MLSDETTFRMMRAAVDSCIAPTSWCAAIRNTQSKQTCGHVLFWDSLIGNKARRGLCFLLNVTTSGSDCNNVLPEYLPGFLGIYEYDYFMHNNGPCHQSETVQKLLNNSGVHILEWPGNTPCLNPIKDAGNVMNNKVQETRPTNFRGLTESMSKWPHMVL